MKITLTIDKLINVTSADPDDERRRRLLNILLTGVALIAILGIVSIGMARLANMVKETDAIRLLSWLSAAFLGFVCLFLINRYVSGALAGALFVIFLTSVISISDAAQQVVEGRALFLFTIPILIASVILRPWASFAMAGVCSLVITFIARLHLEEYATSPPPIPTMLGFFAIAFVAWLSSRSLEGALEEVRAINRELDQRVEDRTRELLEANIQLAEANVQLADANERLQEIDRLKSRFVAMVSHELRTPLSAIRGFTEMFLAGIYGALPESQEGAMKRIAVNTEQLLHLVNDLLDQARIEAGQLSLRSEPVALRELFEDVRSTLSVLAAERNLALTAQVADDLPPVVYGDPQRLKQIFINLANNAIKFTEEGAITIAARRANADHWAITVSDTGIGIPEEAREYIFDPFRQVDSSMTREHKGTGMGLAIVKQLTHLMGGSVVLESELGQGSTFTVQLPIVIEAQGGAS